MAPSAAIVDSFIQLAVEDAKPAEAQQEFCKEIISNILDQFEGFQKPLSAIVFGPLVAGYGGKSTPLQINLTSTTLHLGKKDAREIISALASNYSGGNYHLLHSGEEFVTWVDATRSQTVTLFSQHKEFGIYTTRLLQVYSNLHQRSAQLAVLLNRILVASNLQDSFTPLIQSLLVIYFLQRCQPPVLPCLHELHDVVGGHDILPRARFETDPKAIQRLWHCDNKSSISELWILLLQFYQDYDQFGFDKKAISVRSSRDTPRGSSWSSTFSLVIPDPEMPTTNLASAIRKKDLILFCKVLRVHLQHLTKPQHAVHTLSVEAFSTNCMQLPKANHQNYCPFRTNNVLTQCPLQPHDLNFESLNLRSAENHDSENGDPATPIAASPHVPVTVNSPLESTVAEQNSSYPIIPRQLNYSAALRSEGLHLTVRISCITQLLPILELKGSFMICKNLQELRLVAKLQF